MGPGQLHITKLAAAQRQLRAAIRLYFAREDELAIHTVASAAYRLLADLKAARGMDEASSVYLTTIFYAVRDFRRGTLPKEMTSDSKLMAWVQEMADLLPIDANSSVKDVSITLSSKLAREFWSQRNKIANFLKHADRDSVGAISIDDVDNLPLLMQCYSAYMDVTPEHLGNEGLVFELFLGVKRNIPPVERSQQEGLIEKLHSINEAERYRVCSMLIAKLNEADAHG